MRVCVIVCKVRAAGAVPCAEPPDLATSYRPTTLAAVRG